MAKLQMAKLQMEGTCRLLRDCVVVQKNSVVSFVALAFAVSLICITAVHYIRSSSHEAFRFGGGETLIEGASNGCEPKDIIELGDSLSQEPVISSLKGNNTSLEKYPELKKSMEVFGMFVMMAKAASTMRSKPDEHLIRKMFSDMASNKNLDCNMNNFLQHIDKGPYSAADTKVFKSYATRFEEIGRCIGACKEK